MGIFSDPCENPDCGARVKKGAHFCSKCGWAGANSLTRCPNPDCGKRVGRASAFCWSCGVDMAATAPPRIMGNRWVRDEEEFAVRVYPADLDAWLDKQVTVEAGTLGLLEKDGRITKDIQWGGQPLRSIIHRFAPTSIILVSAADAVLRPTFHGLRDANGALFDIQINLVFRVTDYAAFARQYFEGHKRRVSFRIIEERLARELFDVVRGLVIRETLEGMYGNLVWRDKFEHDIRDAMTVTLSRHGLELMQVNFVDFGGDHYEQLQQERGEVYMGNRAADHLAETLAIRKRMAELQGQGKLDAERTNKDYAAELKELTNQTDIRVVLSDAEREETVRQARHELELRSMLRLGEKEEYESELQKAQLERDNATAKAIILARQDRDALETDFRRRQRELENEQTFKEAWEAGELQRRNERANAVQRYELIIQESQARASAQLEQLKVDQGKQDLVHRDRDHQAAMLERVQASERETLKMMQGLKLEEKKLEFDYKRFKKEKDAELETRRIEANVTVAVSEETKKSAVAEARADEMKQRLTDKEAEITRSREDAQRRAQDLKDIAGIVGGTRNQPTVVVSGAGGSQVIGGAGMMAGQTPCPNCGRPVELTDDFCRKCGHDMRSNRK